MNDIVLKAAAAHHLYVIEHYYVTLSRRLQHNVMHQEEWMERK